MLAPAVLCVLALVVALAVLTWGSLHEYDAFNATEGQFSTQNFSDTLGSAFFREVLLRTVLMSLLVTALAVLAGLPIAYAMVRTNSKVLRSAILALVFVPFLVGDVVRAYGWLVVGGAEGPLADLLKHVGIDRFSLLGSPGGVALGLLQLMIPLTAIVLLPAIRSIDPELEQAATVMGARARQRWFRIVLPLARRGVAAASAVSFTLSMTALATPQLLGLGQFDFVSNRIQSTYFLRGNTNLASAMGVIALLVTVVGVVLLLAMSRDPAEKVRRRSARSVARAGGAA
jgi:putative spermidine/putrescine transport system permease protein